MTNPHSVRVDLGFKVNLSTVAAAFDFHGVLLREWGLAESADYRASILSDERLLTSGLF
jgi:hypothetical protein